MQFKAIEQQFYQIRSNKFFESFVVGIIVFSALVIGVKTYDIPPVVNQIVVFLDWLITGIFLVEIVIRFIGDPDKKSFFKKKVGISDIKFAFPHLSPSPFIVPWI